MVTALTARECCAAGCFGRGASDSPLGQSGEECPGAPADRRPGYCRGRPSCLSGRLRAAAAGRARGVGRRSADARARLLKRHQKRYVPGKAGQSADSRSHSRSNGNSPAPGQCCALNGIDTLPVAARWFVGADVMLPWLRERLLETPPRAAPRRDPRRHRAAAAARAGETAGAAPAAGQRRAGGARLSVPDLPRLDAELQRAGRDRQPAGDRARRRR